jgi:hypothetical protein
MFSINHLSRQARRAGISTLLASCTAVGVLTGSLGVTATTYASSLPDLTTTFSTPAKLALGDSTDVTFTLTNNGSVSADSSLFLIGVTNAQSLKILQQPSHQTITCSTNNLSYVMCDGMELGHNQSDSVKVQVTASNTSENDMTVTATADLWNAVVESDETNNQLQRSINVFKQPDLKASVLDGPETVKGGADVTFKVKVDSLGGSASNIGLHFGDTNGLVYNSVDFVGDDHGFSCDIHNPAFDNNYVDCSGGSLGDPNADPAGDSSVTLKIGASVKDRGLTTSKDRTVTFTVDPDHKIAESNESNNTDKFNFHYD